MCLKQHYVPEVAMYHGPATCNDFGVWVQGAGMKNKHEIVNTAMCNDWTGGIGCEAEPKTSFPLKRNGPNDLNKMISKFYGCKCKIDQGE